MTLHALHAGHKAFIHKVPHVDTLHDIPTCIPTNLIFFATQSNILYAVEVALLLTARARSAFSFIAPAVD